MLPRRSLSDSPTGRPCTSGKAFRDRSMNRHQEGSASRHEGLRTRPPQRKSRKPATRDVLDRLLTTCSGSIVIDLRDRSILLGAFMAGGRRRS